MYYYTYFESKYVRKPSATQLEQNVTRVSRKMRLNISLLAKASMLMWKKRRTKKNLDKIRTFEKLLENYEEYKRGFEDDISYPNEIHGKI